MPPTAALYGILATGSALVLSALYIIKPLRKLALFLLYALGCILLLVRYFGGWWKKPLGLGKWAQTQNMAKQ